MKLNRNIYVVGGAVTPFIGKYHPDFIWKGHPEFGKKTNPEIEDYIHRVVKDALASSGVTASHVQKGYIGNFLGELFSKQGHMGAMVAAAHPDLEGKPFARIEGACASGGLAISACVDALQAGYDVTLAVGAEVETSFGVRDATEFMARAAHYGKERHLDEHTFPYMFARRAHHYKEAFGATNEDIGRVVAKAYANGNRNPNAHMRTVKMDLAYASTMSEKNSAFLTSERYRQDIKHSDCTHFSDGAASVILATEDGLKRLGIRKNRCVQLMSVGHATAGLGKETDPTQLVTMAASAKIAYDDAGVGPDAMNVAEVHDCFAISELQAYEALGFAARGEAPALLKRGDTQIGGRLPVNTGGGLLSFGHPVGATGVKQVFEIYRQMKGQCGDYQIPSKPLHGVTANMGGDDRTAVVMVFRNCPD